MLSIIDYIKKNEIYNMPDRYIHDKISKILLGNKCDETHSSIDGPVKDFGAGHRKYYHSIPSAALIGLLENGYRGAISGILHVITDEHFDNYIYKESLRFSLKMIDYAKNEIECIQL